MAARGRKPKDAPSPAKSLQEALAFCAPAYRDIGEVHQTHVVMHGKMLYAFDGVLACGHPIDDDVTVCPQGTLLRGALARAGSGLSLALESGGLALAVKIGGFRARVPCVSLDAIAPFAPDAMAMQVDSRLHAAFGMLAPLSANSGTTVIESSLLLGADTLTATNRVMIMQAWHGLSLPYDFVIPRAFASAVFKCDKEWAGIGYSDRTFTVWFADGAWMRTQLYAEPWPDIAPVLADMTGQGEELPDDFFAACEAVLPFAGELGRVYVVGSRVATGAAEAQAAASQRFGPAKAPLLDPLPVLSGKLLRHIAGRVSHVDWLTGERAVHFYGEGVRCALMRHAEDAPAVALAADDAADIDTENTVEQAA